MALCRPFFLAAARAGTVPSAGSESIRNGGGDAAHDFPSNQTRRPFYMASIEEKVKECIVTQLGVNEDEVTNEASFIDDLGADSLDIVELVMAFEEKFNIEIPDEDVEKLRTVGDAVKYVTEKGAA